jgi:hypothetical protein
MHLGWRLVLHCFVESPQLYFGKLAEWPPGSLFEVISWGVLLIIGSFRIFP